MLSRLSFPIRGGVSKKADIGASFFAVTESAVAAGSRSMRLRKTQVPTRRASSGTV